MQQLVFDVEQQVEISAVACSRRRRASKREQGGVRPQRSVDIKVTASLPAVNEKKSACRTRGIKTRRVLCVECRREVAHPGIQVSGVAIRRIMGVEQPTELPAQQFRNVHGPAPVAMSTLTTPAVDVSTVRSRAVVPCTRK